MNCCRVAGDPIYIWILTRKISSNLLRCALSFIFGILNCLGIAINVHRIGKVETMKHMCECESTFQQYSPINWNTRLVFNLGNFYLTIFSWLFLCTLLVFYFLLNKSCTRKSELKLWLRKHVASSFIFFSCRRMSMGRLVWREDFFCRQ